MLQKHEAKARHSHEYDAIARVQISFINQLCGIGFLARHRNPLHGNVTSKENDTPQKYSPMTRTLFSRPVVEFGLHQENPTVRNPRY